MEINGGEKLLESNPNAISLKLKIGAQEHIQTDQNQTEVRPKIELPSCFYLGFFAKHARHHKRARERN